MTNTERGAALTWEVIHEMTAGPKLDAIIAERVMGLNVEWMNGQPCHWTERTPTAKDYHLIPRYSTDIATAWRVIERLRDAWTKATEHASGFRDDFDRPFDDFEFFEYLHRRADRRWPWALLYMTPHDICRAALLSWPGVREEADDE